MTDTASYSREALRAALHAHPLTLRELVELAIDTALARSNHNVSQAARALGLSRSSMHRRMKRLCRAPNAPRPE